MDRALQIWFSRRILFLGVFFVLLQQSTVSAFKYSSCRYPSFRQCTNLETSNTLSSLCRRSYTKTHRPYHTRRSVSRDRRPFIGGNWKSNGTVATVSDLIKMLNKNAPSGSIDVVVAPPTLHLEHVLEYIKPEYGVSSQNVAVHKGYGAYTGEVSATMLKDLEIEWTLAGHSERREGFGMPGESSDLVSLKTKNAIDEGLNVIACIGEKLDDRETDKTMVILGQQLQALKNVLSVEDWKHIVLAYEPVWAIGTGKSATPTMAQDTHKAVRAWIRDHISPEVGKSVRILYGGSVKGSNASELAATPDIDGFLVGGASLTEDFIAIIDATAKEFEKLG